MRELLCEVVRAGRIESVHRGAVAVVEDGRALLLRGDVAEPVFMRSCAKPIQSCTVVESGAADAFGIEAEELAVVSGSHLGEPEHLRAVASVLRKARLTPRLLQCGVHPPLSPRGLRALHRSRREPGAIHNNCSGKHAGMLAAARRLGAPLASYLDLAHPVQRANLARVARLSGVSERRIPLGIDGCSAPTFALPLRAMARAMARFSVEAGAARRVREAMMAHPAMVGRPCAELMSAAPGRILGKVGAEGVYLCGLPGEGVGIAVKIADGSVRPILHVLAAVFRRLRLLAGPDLARVERAASPILRNHAGRVVGRIRVSLR